MSNHRNLLSNETSPYLLQHANNPVNWFPWGEAALQKAISEDKPILVSIGYSACHWCHVMERESFENEDTALLMNEHFINIKIDREERPDLDHIYMDAVQAISGNGGWPLNVFLTPQGKPFYGGTYFPPVRAFNRSSWKEVLLNVSTLFKEKRQEVEAQATQLLQHISSNGEIQISKNELRLGIENLFSIGDARTVFENIMKQADLECGGFGHAPKFPQTFVINYLLRYYYHTGNKNALNHACLSLDKMIYGGIYDQAGGGFARYATDQEWLAPHFEKMLYDNALLIATMSDAYRITANKIYEQAIRRSISFLKRELLDTSLCFYSALDADSEGEEGKFYVWSYEEIHEILGKKATLFCEFYDVTQGGNWEHTNILRVLVPATTFALKLNMAEEDLLQQLNEGLESLMMVRKKRTRPSLDDKILVGWNAMTITALCKASAALGDTNYKDLAVNAFQFLWANCKNPGSFAFSHTIKNGIVKYPAFLDDYACLVEACINLQEITSNVIYVEHAKGLCEFVEDQFSASSGYYYFTGSAQTDTVVRKTEIYDGATPSGNSLMAYNLHYLGIILNNKAWSTKASDLIYGVKHLIKKYPSSFGNWACLMLDLTFGIEELVIVGNGFEDARDIILAAYIPNKIFQSTQDPQKHNYPFFNNKQAGQKPLLYRCYDYSCQAPESNILEAVKRIVKKEKIVE